MVTWFMLSFSAGLNVDVDGYIHDGVVSQISSEDTETTFERQLFYLDSLFNVNTP